MDNVMCWKKCLVLDSEELIIREWHIAYSKLEESFLEIKWFPPRESVIKFNFNGSYTGGTVIGCGGIIRDLEGKFLLGYNFNSMGDNALMAEVKSLHVGYRLIIRFNSPIIIEWDSLSIIKMARKEWTSP